LGGERQGNDRDCLPAPLASLINASGEQENSFKLTVQNPSAVLHSRCCFPKYPVLPYVKRIDYTDKYVNRLLASSCLEQQALEGQFTEKSGHYLYSTRNYPKIEYLRKKWGKSRRSIKHEMVFDAKYRLGILKSSLKGGSALKSLWFVT